MARNGSGTYSLPAGNPVVTGTTISSTTHNTTMSDIATAITQSIASDGQTTPSANLPMGNYKHTGVANATARDQYAAAGQVQDGALMGLTSVSGTDTITASATPAITAYATHQTFRFISSGANTGPVTIDINSVGAKAITKNGTTALVAGDIPSGAVCEIVYDGTQFQLIGLQILPISRGGTGATTASAARSALGVLAYALGTPVAAAAQTAIDYTDLPAGIKRIKVMFDQSSLSGTAGFLVQLGDSGGFETSGYSSTVLSDNGATNTNSTAGFILTNPGLSGAVLWRGAPAP